MRMEIGWRAAVLFFLGHAFDLATFGPVTVYAYMVAVAPCSSAHHSVDAKAHSN